MKTAEINKMLGRPHRMIGLRDSDGDGVKNIFDCEPYNAKKQGIIHDWMERRRLRKAGVSEDKVKGYQAKRSKEIEIAKSQAYKEEKIRYYKEREKIRTDRKLKYEREGGFGGAVGRFGMGLSKARSSMAPKPIRRKTKKKMKKGRRATTTYAAAQPKKRSMHDFRPELNFRL